MQFKAFESTDSQNFPQHGRPFKGNSRHLRILIFKIFSNHGGQFKCILRHLKVLILKFLVDNFSVIRCIIWAFESTGISKFSPTVMDNLNAKCPVPPIILQFFSCYPVNLGIKKSTIIKRFLGPWWNKEFWDLIEKDLSEAFRWVYSNRFSSIM